MLSSTEKRERKMRFTLKMNQRKCPHWSADRHLFVLISNESEKHFFNIVSDGNQVQQQGRLNPQPGPFCCIFGAVKVGPICLIMADARWIYDCSSSSIPNQSQRWTRPRVAISMPHTICWMRRTSAAVNSKGAVTWAKSANVSKKCHGIGTLQE